MVVRTTYLPEVCVPHSALSFIEELDYFVTTRPMAREFVLEDMDLQDWRVKVARCVKNLETLQRPSASIELAVSLMHCTPLKISSSLKRPFGLRARYRFWCHIASLNAAATALSIFSPSTMVATSGLKRTQRCAPLSFQVASRIRTWYSSINVEQRL